MEFVQEAVTTLHDLGNPDPTVDLAEVGVVVPVGGEDAIRDSVRRTLRIVADHDPGSLVIPVRGDRTAVGRIRSILEDHPVPATVLWCNAPGTQELLRSYSVPATGSKGLDVWLGLVLATQENDIVAVHDADVTSYSLHQLPRLVWPITRGHSFAKAYYARVEDERLYGRLSRLFLTPLLTALAAEHDAPILEYLQAFRYPLAGEFACRSNVVRSLRIPRGFGLEIGVLGETYRIAGPREAAQVDLGWHRHDHRPVTGPDGLVPMARAVGGTLDAVLRENDVHVDIQGVRDAYRRQAERYLEQYAADAAFNGLRYEVGHERSQSNRYANALDEVIEPTWLPPIEEVEIAVDELRTAGVVGDPQRLDARGEAD